MCAMKNVNAFMDGDSQRRRVDYNADDPEDEDAYKQPALSYDDENQDDEKN